MRNITIRNNLILFIYIYIYKFYRVLKMGHYLENVPWSEGFLSLEYPLKTDSLY